MFDLDEEDAPKDEANEVELADVKPENEDPEGLDDALPNVPPGCFDVSLIICK